MNKSLLSVALFLSVTAFAQKPTDVVPDNWHQLDKATTGYYGISLDKAYEFAKSKKLKSNQVIVAVIDGGIDTLHEDLKPVLWTNTKEIPGNGIDDDHNGYIDDIHGWNFLGNKDGRNVKEDSYEAARVYTALKAKFGDEVPDSASTKQADQAEVALYRKVKEKIVGSINPDEVAFVKQLLPNFLKGDSIIKKDLGKEEYSCTDLEKYVPTEKDAKNTKMFLTQICKGNKTNDITNKQIIGELQGELRKAEAATTAPEEYRKNVVLDDENDINDRYYGNSDVMTGTPFHGTHCAGIVGAVEYKGKGLAGIATNVRIMMVRAVPDGDEHDKDIANAIRYAVDNGAQIISMSFGKEFSPKKQWVDDAVRYAESRDVLLVHAAGNDAKNVDSTDNFPNPVYLDNGQKATNWITVGASGDPKNGGITAGFSNYGKKEVDVFAPGVEIYSTIPGGTTNYGHASGTSMACPVVTGTAALLLEYFPKLSAAQLKFIIEKSAVAPSMDVNIPEPGVAVVIGGKKKTVKLSELCKSGGLLNAYEAIKLAATLKGDRKQNKTVLPKQILTNNKQG